MSYFAALTADIAGKLGELKTPRETGSPTFRKRQAIREYNDLLDRTDPTAPAGSPSIKCISSDKAVRRRKRHDLIRKAQNTAAAENDPDKKKRIQATTDRLQKDMDRVEDAKLSLHAYTANEDEATQEEFLKPLRKQAPPGFKIASLDQMAEDFGVDKERLKDLVNGAGSQKIMVYERDAEVFGSGPRYTIAFRGSTTSKSDWNNNGRNEAGFEAPHQNQAARLGSFLERGAARQGVNIDTLISATGHSKGGSEAQAFAAGSGCTASVFNPAGFDPQQYVSTSGVKRDSMRIDRTTVIERDGHGNLIPSGDGVPHTDPLYFAQEQGLSSFIMKKPVTSGTPRELAPIDPNLSVVSDGQSDTEAHSMLQVIEALERDKRADQATLDAFVRPRLAE